MDYFPPEVQEISPLKTLTNADTEANAMVIAIISSACTVYTHTHNMDFRQG